jgi:hypothetical protein
MEEGRSQMEDGRGKRGDGVPEAPISNLQSPLSTPHPLSTLPSSLSTPQALSTPRRPWPCYFFKSDTTGEKEFEEFFAQGERLVLDRFKRVGIVKGEGGGGRRTEDGRGERGEGQGSGGRPPSLGFGVAQAGGGPISHLQSPISNASLKVAVNDFLGFVRRAKTDPTITKADYVREIQKLVPTLQHQETGRNLDQKM